MHLNACTSMYACTCTPVLAYQTQNAINTCMPILAGQTQNASKCMHSNATRMHALESMSLHACTWMKWTRKNRERKKHENTNMNACTWNLETRMHALQKKNKKTTILQAIASIKHIASKACAWTEKKRKKEKECTRLNLNACTFRHCRHALACMHWHACTCMHAACTCMHALLDNA